MARRPGRVTGKAARRNRWYSKRRNQWIAAVVALVVLCAGGVALALSGSDDDKETAGDRWKREVVGDFAGMSQGAVSYLQTVNEWRTDKADERSVDAAADLALGQFLTTRESLAEREPFPPAPRALTNYRDAVELYIAHARLAKLGAALRGKDNEQLNRQIQLIMGRVRYIADRTYDLGSDELAPFTTQEQEVPGFEYNRAVDVPSFAGTDLAPGAPLSQPQPGVPQNREYQNVRPEGTIEDWKAAVEAAKIPPVEAEVKAIRDGSSDELDRLAKELTAAADALYAAPDPQDERELNTRVMLGLLTQAEAMRVAQVSRLVPAELKTEAIEITQVLALLGNGMWDDARLGERDPGYPRTLLTERPAVAPPPLPEVPDEPIGEPSASPDASPGGEESPEPSGTPAASPAATPEPSATPVAG
ncbi:hypothetical protein GCM10009547_36930 [Sporichthya brevicatena]|uniref:Uncharacterized protein n=1 Tax=Sporichthya brevicatena TaxID=171442 RepID=A0ABN1H636_9ACTN